MFLTLLHRKTLLALLITTALFGITLTLDKTVLAVWQFDPDPPTASILNNFIINGNQVTFPVEADDGNENLATTTLVHIGFNTVAASPPPSPPWQPCPTSPTPITSGTIPCVKSGFSMIVPSGTKTHITSFSLLISNALGKKNGYYFARVKDAAGNWSAWGSIEGPIPQPPFIQTKEGDVHSNQDIKVNQ